VFGRSEILKWLFPPVRIAIPPRLAKLFLADPSRTFAFDELSVSARIGAYRLSWILNQMTRYGILVADILPGSSNGVGYRLGNEVSTRLRETSLGSLNDDETEKFLRGLAGREMHEPQGWYWPSKRQPPRNLGN
jgi:hypothetical protein